LMPGHSPGCQTVIVETAEGKAAVTGFCSIMDNFDVSPDVRETTSPMATYPAIAAGIHSNLFQAYESAIRLKGMDVTIIPSHDPDMAKLKQIP
ncbi:MAG: hypothetical protein PHV70_12850, partial [Desulfobacteraceae bacterium]|nr:hypothetical protein [Desulfobacteraceae bacterium]